MKAFLKPHIPTISPKIATLKPSYSIRHFNPAFQYRSTQLFQSLKLVTQVANVNVIANDLKRGEVIILRDKLLQIKSKAESSAGRRDTFIQLELQDIKTGKKYQERLRSQQDVEVAEIDVVNLTFTKTNEDGVLVFQNNMGDEVTFSEGELFTAYHKAYLQEGTDIAVKMFEEKPIGVMLPDKVELTVVSVSSAADRNSGGSSAIAKLSNGRSIKVPKHIKEGDTIIVKTDEESFIARA